MSSALSPLPIGADEFASLVASFATPCAPKIAIAVSGGGDSMALAFCTQRWAKSNGHSCVAFIVDHALRDESASEAAQVKACLEKLGISAEILRWDHPPITRHLHEQARAARYALLIEACRRHRAHDLMIAHHREDQAETILMRLAKGSGIEGLAGMAVQTLRDDIRLLRPFLNLPKQRLLATCESLGIAYVTDPSNASEKYTRGRLRNIAPLLEKEGLTTETLLDLGTRAAEASDALKHYTREFLGAASVCDCGGSIRLERSCLNLVPRAIALRALTACLRYVHDDDYPPERASLSGLLDALICGESGRTLYGCLVSIAGNTATILREPSAAKEILPFHPDSPLLWDRRWIVSGSAGDVSHLMIRSLGSPPHEVIDHLSPRLRHDIPQGRVRATLPALWQGDSLYAIPSFEKDAPLRLSYRKQGFP